MKSKKLITIIFFLYAPLCIKSVENNQNFQEVLWQEQAPIIDLHSFEYIWFCSLNCCNNCLLAKGPFPSDELIANHLETHKIQNLEIYREQGTCFIDTTFYFLKWCVKGIQFPKILSWDNFQHYREKTNQGGSSIEINITNGSYHFSHYCCRECDVQVKTLTGLQTHYSEMHNNPCPSLPTVTFRCITHGKLYTNEQSAISHLHLKHSHHQQEI